MSNTSTLVVSYHMEQVKNLLEIVLSGDKLLTRNHAIFMDAAQGITALSYEYCRVQNAGSSVTRDKLKKLKDELSAINETYFDVLIDQASEIETSENLEKEAAERISALVKPTYVPTGEKTILIQLIDEGDF